MRRKLLLSACASCLLAFAAGGLSAQVAHQASGPLGALAFSDARLKPAPAIQPLEAAQSSLATEARAAWALFQAASPVRWQAYVDQRTGQLDSAVGGGIPWIASPGRPGDTTLEELEKTARDFFPRVSALLGVDAESLVLDRGRSGRQADHLWYVDFNVQRAGLTIEGARVVFRVSHGNLIEIGAEGLPSPEAAVPAARLTREQAQAAVADFVRGFDDFDAGDSFTDPGSLHLLPVEQGDGRGLALVWQLTFHRRGVEGTWRARVDAASGEVLELLDVNRYGRVSGGAFADSPTTGPETLLPMPFADAGAGFADSAGFFSSPLPVTSELDGRYVKINDSCGAITKGSDWKGDIEFGASAGTDCSVPGSGGRGDTHAARTQFYHVNRIKEAGRAWLPGNLWLQGQLAVNVNLSQTCNAYWDGETINFFKSGNGCGNTGELAGVSLHEYGHGLDENDGNGPAPDYGTGETYGDFTAALSTHSSCIGSGFRSVHCGGYGDACTACTGVRDIDWAKHAAATPATVDGFTRLRCPLGGGYDGPCGREGHCESYVASEALWDFTSRDLPNPGSAGAWMIGERLWYLSRATATAAFTCSTTVVPWTSSGCATGSLWRTMRAADDDDGNLTNGTPHSCQLYTAFNRHNIACPADLGANVCFSACTPPPVPSLTLTPGAGQVQVSWTSSGAGAVYDVYRSELGCNAGFVRIAGNVAATGYLDTAVAGGFPYFYQVVAHPVSGTACSAAPTSCQSATPTAPACAPPAVPTGVTAAGVGISRIDLSWAAAGGAAGYNVYRAASLAGPYTLRASVAAPALSFSDTGLSGGATWFYKVRSYAAACESADSAAVSAATVPCVTVPLYRSDFETGSGLAGWTASILTGGSATNDWRGIQACGPAHSGSSVFRFGAATCGAFYGNSEIAAVAPPAVAVPAAGTGNTRLTFWHRRSFEAGYDGGLVGAAVDGGSLVFGPDTAVSGEAYDGTVAGPGPNTCPPGSMGGRSAFTGAKSAMAETVVDLDAICDLVTAGTGGCAGHSVQPHFVSVSDCFQGGTGWFLDDVQVTTCAFSTGALDYHTLAPCRLIDTRNPAGPLGGPALAAGAERTFALTGACGIPAAAKALSINLTVVEPGGSGFLQALPGGAGASVSSAINFSPGSTRANNLLLTLAYDGSGTVLVRSGASLPVDFLLDVTGYFQ
jgi:hypothetical protein